MYTRLMTKDDMPVWLDMAHQADDIIGELIPDVAVFYRGFDEYMKTKIKKNEALMVLDSTSNKCAGIAAFSRKDNRITYLGVAPEADFTEVGCKLLETVLDKLDAKHDITVNVIKSGNPVIQQERKLYEKYGFAEDKADIVESGVPACRMKRPPSQSDI